MFMPKNISVVLRHRVDADPDPTFHFAADPDPDLAPGFIKIITFFSFIHSKASLHFVISVL
jgi:hypothetical protein